MEEARSYVAGISKSHHSESASMANIICLCQFCVCQVHVVPLRISYHYITCALRCKVHQFIKAFTCWWEKTDVELFTRSVILIVLILVFCIGESQYNIFYFVIYSNIFYLSKTCNWLIWKHYYLDNLFTSDWHTFF